MITCNLMGGLGNQLFQIFTTITYAIKSYNSFKFTNAEKLGIGNTIVRHTYWNTFLKKLGSFTANISEFPQLKVINEVTFSYQNIPLSELINQNVILFGYFQSYKYFQTHFLTIYRLLGIEELKNKVLQKLKCKNIIFDFNTTISLHFRLGDYKELQHIHPIVTYRYYKKSLDCIKSSEEEHNFTILYFCEEEDVDEVKQTIDDLILKFPNYTFIRCEYELDDWEQLLLMSCCRYNIIANSSFSWWGAYFNMHSDKIVCYPSVWFGERVENDTKDLCPESWIKIPV